MAAEDLTVGVLGRFLADRQSVGSKMRSERALAPLLGYLRGVGVAPEAEPPAPGSSAEALLAAFAGYLSVERGLAAVTVAGYVTKARPFVAAFPDVDRWRGLTARQVRDFVTRRAAGRPATSAKAEAKALRARLRWMWMEGMTSAPLAGAVGSFAAARGTRPPRGLTVAEVKSLRRAVRQGPDRLRNEAMVALMLRLGLRAGEVVALRLEDIDWPAGVVRISGKDGRLDALPLPSDVGRALADYLTRGRPPAVRECRQVFLRSSAPHVGLASVAVSMMVSKALRRAGVTGAGAAHRLRHTAACGVLATGGGMLEARQLLRHSKLESTAVYAKADLPALQSLARPWPRLEAQR